MPSMGAVGYIHMVLPALSWLDTSFHSTKSGMTPSLLYFEVKEAWGEGGTYLSHQLGKICTLSCGQLKKGPRAGVEC